MRRISLILLVVIIFGLIISSVYGAVNTEYISYQSSAISISMLKQEPDPIEPGSVVEITFKLQNDGAVAKGVEFEILPEYPFTLFGDKSLREIGSLSRTQNDKYSEIVEYKLRVANNAPDGNHEIKVRYKSEGFQTWTIVEGFTVNVRTSNPILGVNRFFSTPAIVGPGENTKLSIELENYAASMVKDVQVKLDLEGLPVNPMGTTNEKIQSRIDGGSKQAFDFHLLVDSDADSKAYKIPLEIDYSDLFNKNMSVNNVITLVVGSKPDLAITIDSTDLYTSGAGTVSVRVTNKGVSDIKLLNTKLQETDDVNILSSEIVYIGNIDSDDYETAEFDLYIDSSVKGEVNLPLVIEYKDSNNKNFIENVNLKMDIYSKADAKKFGLISGGSKVGLVVIIILIIVGVFWYRRKKKKRKG